MVPVRRNTFTILLLVCLSILEIYGQKKSLHFEYLTVDDGLSSNYVTCIYQDSRGFLWFGTDDGLNLFDGEKVTTYQNSVSKSNSLKNSHIDAIIEDLNGNLLIGTSKGLQVYDWSTNSFKPFDFPNCPQSLIEGNIEKAVVNEETIWIAVENQGLFALNYETNKISHFKDIKDEPNKAFNNIDRIYKDRKGNIWLISYGVLSIFNESTESFKHLDLKNSTGEGCNINSIAQDSEGKYWIGTYEEGIIEATFDDKYEVSEAAYHLTYPLARELFSDHEGNIWFGVEGEGLATIPNGDIDQLQLYKAEIKPNKLNFPGLLTIFEDSFGDIWLGTVGGGVNILHFKKQAFTHWMNVPYENSPSANDINQFSEDSNEIIWFGTKTGGINSFNKVSGDFRYFNVENSFLTSNSVVSVIHDGNGDIWCGGWESGLIHTDKNFNRIDWYDTDNSGLISNHIFDLAEDKSGNIWIGTLHGGIAKLDRSTGEITSFIEEGTITYKNPIAIELGSNNNLYFGGYNGLGVYNTINDEYNIYKFKPDLSSISSDRIQAIYAENDSLIWIGTADGLNKFNCKTNQFRHYFMEDGLASNSIKGITKDSKNRFWITTNLGLSLFNPVAETFLNFSKEDGLQANQFNPESILVTNEDELFVGGVNGFNYFEADEVKMNTTPPEIVVTKLEVDGQSIPWYQNSNESASNNDIPEITLDAGTTIFTFSFVGINYTSSKMNQYSYRLQGYDNIWYPSNDQKAVFHGIPPGDYTFQVKASNNHGYWNDKPASVRIHLLAPWWNQNWFKVTTGTVLILAFYIGYKSRTNSLKRQKEKLELEVDVRTKDLQNTLHELKDTQTKLVQSEKMASVGVLIAGIAHEINNPLQLINGGRDLISRELKHEKLEMLDDMQSSLEMIDQGVNRASNIVSRLTSFNNYTSDGKMPYDLHEILDNCLLMMNKQFGDRIDVQKSYSEKLPEMEGNPPELHQAFLSILKNCDDSIDNKGTVIIKTSVTNSKVHLAIADDGKGIKKEDLTKVMDPFFTTKEPGQGIGMGMAIAYQILNRHGCEIKYHSEVGKGTEVEMSFKV